MRSLLLPAGLCLAITVGVFVRVSPLLIYNGSPSAPLGFYVRSGAPRLGSYVTVRAAAVAPGYSALRNFSGPRNFFIKRIAASAGTHVCARGDRVEVNGTPLRRLAVDRAGRILPAWRGCRILTTDEFFLVGDTSDSFDSRYWGPVRGAQLEGVWTPWLVDRRKH